ncbi:hypothetical protein C0J52_11881 [Blattella germanica]|nr:hypothetical protein C0J52_11881 [Blattella germanica]
MDENNLYLDHIHISDESNFHISGKVNRHNSRIWGSGIPSVVFQHEHDSPKVNVCCGLMKDCMIGPFFFAKPTVTAICWSCMLSHSFLQEPFISKMVLLFILYLRYASF